MKFGSICSGIEAASVAFEPFGWKAAWFSEIESAPSSLLAHRYPTVINHGDMTRLPQMIRDNLVEIPDVLCGGTPCQAFSLAGQRKSLNDARGNISLTFCEIANELDAKRHEHGQPPIIVVWENVPGVLSTKDNAFGCFLAGLAGEDLPIEPPGGKWTNAGCVVGPERTVAWRITDAQYFGVAQRRRRVFVVASARNGFDPPGVLFEFEGVRRDSAPSREAGEEIAPCLRAGATNGSPGHGARSGDSRDELIVPVGGFGVAGTLGANHGNVKADGKDTNGQHVADNKIIPVVTVAFRGRDGGATAELGGEVGNCLRASSGGGDKAYVLAPVFGVADVMRMAHGQGGAEIASNRSPTLTCNHEAQIVVGSLCAAEDETGRGTPLVPPNTLRVRRLTPRECERLQGFPDDYTLVPHNRKPMANGNRYKALGNSWAVPNVRWIGERIQQQVDVLDLL